MVFFASHQSVAGDALVFHYHLYYLDQRHSVPQRAGYLSRLGGCEFRATNPYRIATEALRTHSIAFTRLLHGRRDGSIDAARAFGNHGRAAPADTSPADPRDRRDRADHCDRLFAGVELANDARAVRAGASYCAHVPFHQRQTSA